MNPEPFSKKRDNLSSAFTPMMYDEHRGGIQEQYIHIVNRNSESIVDVDTE